MKLSAILIIGLSVFLSSCGATSVPSDPAERATYHVNRAKAEISRGECSRASREINWALARPTGAEQIRELLSDSDRGSDCYLAQLESDTQNVTDVRQANSRFGRLTLVESADIFSEEQVNALFENLRTTVAEGNESGAVPFDLGDSIDNFPDLQSPNHQQIIIERTIESLQENEARNRPVLGLMAYVEKVGVDSAEGEYIESLLPSLNIRQGELGTVAELFPAFAEIWMQELVARVYFHLENGDRLLEEDFREMLHKEVGGVEWVSSSGKGVTTLMIEQVRSSETTLPETTQTITYSYIDVNVVDAVLYMPRNASYLFDLISGGTEIEYGYVVSASQNGEVIHDEVIRGTISEKYNRCQNERIRNVFGGVTAANFVANDDMRSRCRGPNSLSLDSLRNKVLSKVVDEVLSVPPIARVHDLN